MDDCAAVLEVERAAAKASRGAKGLGEKDGQRREGIGRVFPEPRLVENVDAGDIVLVGDQSADRDIRVSTPGGVLRFHEKGSVVLIQASWIQNFMDHQGQAALVNCLTPLTYTEGSCPPPTDIDEGLMHCLSRSIGKHRVSLSMPYKKI